MNALRRRARRAGVPSPRQVREDLSLLRRNLGFVFRHVLPARRLARAYLERLVDDPPAGCRAYCGLALLELAHLHAHFGERDAAARRAAQAAEVFARQGAQNALRQVQPLAASLQQR